MFSKSDLESRLMDAINKRLTKKGEHPGTEKYWTCRNREGALPKLVNKFLNASVVRKF